VQDRNLRAVGRSFHFRKLMAQERRNAYVLGAVFAASIGLGLRAMFLDLEKPPRTLPRTKRDNDGAEGPDL
jgi:hypothetical protein